MLLDLPETGLGDCSTDDLLNCTPSPYLYYLPSVTNMLADPNFIL
jgi:hypothetical protein